MERGWPRIFCSASAAVLMLALLLVMVGADAASVKGPRVQQHEKVVESAACSNSISDLMPCYDAIKKQGSPPNSVCCSTMSGWGLDCLCTVLSKYASSMPSFADMSKVLSLPKECNMDVPKGYQCAGFAFPGT